MVDACGAVIAAQACLENPISAACECSADGEPLPPAGDPREELVLEDLTLRIADWRKIPAWILENLICQIDLDCLCLRDPERCLLIGFRNFLDETLDDVTFEFCLNDQCWPTPFHDDEWTPGEPAEVPIVVDPEMRGWLLLNARPSLRLYSEGRLYDVPRGPATDKDDP